MPLSISLAEMNVSSSRRLYMMLRILRNPYSRRGKIAALGSSTLQVIIGINVDVAEDCLPEFQLLSVCNHLNSLHWQA